MQYSYRNCKYQNILKWWCSGIGIKLELNIKLQKMYIQHKIQEKKQSIQQKIEQSNNLQQITIDYLQVDDELKKIDRLDFSNMENISRQSIRRISKRYSNEHDKSQFENRLQLDILIQRLLQNLVATKIQLIELQDINLLKETEKTKEFKNNFLQEIKKYYKTLLLRQSQLGSLVYVMENNSKPNFKQKYLTTYKEIQKFIIPPELCHKPINTVILEQAFQTQIQFLQEYKDMITLVKLNIINKKYLSNLQTLINSTNKLKIISSKISTIAQVFPYACVLEINDLFSFKKTSPRWHNLFQNAITYKIYGSQKQLKKKFNNLKSGLNIVNASMSIMHKSRSSWVGTTNGINVNGITKDLSNLFSSTGKILKCLVFKQNAHHEAEVLFSDPNSDLTKQIWNLPEQKMFRNLISSILPSINFSHQYWIPRVFKQFILNQGRDNIPQLQIPNYQQYRKFIQLQAPYDTKIKIRINSPINLSYRKQRYQIQNQLKKQERYNKMVFSFILKAINTQKPIQNVPSSVILHIHGGGFISMSSFIHQTYTRMWANNLKVPIISVDYGKAPQYPFPHGLHDCFQAYMWTLYCFRQVFQIQPVKVILVGDSAGGNLVAALTNMLINFNLRAPDGIVLVYPALNLNYKNYTPSLLTSLNDMILPHTFLKICLKAYLKQGYSPFDQFISPAYTPDEVLKNYPPTRIFVGSRDPFHDDCCRFVQKLNKFDKNKNKAKLMIFQQFPHGFLQFDVKTQPQEQCRKATKEVENALNDLLNF